MAETVGTSSGIGGKYATLYGYKRRSFYTAGRFWVFYANGTNMVYYTSEDGATWLEGNNSPIRGCGSGDWFSIWFDGTYMHYVYASLSSIYYRRGTPNNDGSITWSASQQTVTTNGNLASYPNVAVDTNGYVWIGYMENRYPYVIKSGSNDGTWGATPAGFPYQLSETTFTAWASCPIPLTNGKMLVIYAENIYTVKAQSWNGSIWGNEVETASGIRFSEYFSAVAEDDDAVHIVFLKYETYDVLYTKYIYSSNSFTAEITLQAGTTSASSPVISRDPSNGDLYVFWAGNPTANHIYYKRCIDTVWDANPMDWIDESAETLTSNDRLTCFYNAYGSIVGLVYMTRMYSPYNIRFDYLIFQPEICDWIDSKGGHIALTITDVFEIVDSFISQTPPSGWGFVTTITEVFGIVDYFLGFNGDLGTDCDYYG